MVFLGFGIGLTALAILCFGLTVKDARAGGKVIAGFNVSTAILVVAVGMFVYSGRVWGNGTPLSPAALEKEEIYATGPKVVVDGKYLVWLTKRGGHRALVFAFDKEQPDCPYVRCDVVGELQPFGNSPTSQPKPPSFAVKEP